MRLAESARSDVAIVAVAKVVGFRFAVVVIIRKRFKILEC